MVSRMLLPCQDSPSIGLHLLVRPQAYDKVAGLFPAAVLRKRLNLYASLMAGT